MGVSSTHEPIEKSVPLLIILVIVAISFGTLVELMPLLFSKKLAEPIAGLGAETFLRDSLLTPFANSRS